MEETYTSEEELAALLKEEGHRFLKKPIRVMATKAPVTLKIKTLEGIMTANRGDWIIRGVNGEYYPCKPDIFEKTYDYCADEEPAFNRQGT